LHFLIHLWIQALEFTSYCNFLLVKSSNISRSNYTRFCNINPSDSKQVKKKILVLSVNLKHGSMSATPSFHLCQAKPLALKEHEGGMWAHGDSPMETRVCLEGASLARWGVKFESPSQRIALWLVEKDKGQNSFSPPLKPKNQLCLVFPIVEFFCSTLRITLKLIAKYKVKLPRPPVIAQKNVPYFPPL
jgi:hypothetical protein